MILLISAIDIEKVRNQYKTVMKHLILDSKTPLPSSGGSFGWGERNEENT